MLGNRGALQKRMLPKGAFSPVTSMPFIHIRRCGSIQCHVRVPFEKNRNTPEHAPENDIHEQKEERMKVSMVSLGCPKNTVDGEVLLGDLFRSGFDVTDDHENSDAIVVNTCGFVEDAKAESIENIIQAAQMKEGGKVKKVVVTGCLAQRYNTELAEQLPEVDLVMGFEKYGGLSSALRDVLGSPPEIDALEYANRSRVQVGESTVGFRPEWDRFRLTPAHTAYLRVAEGCNHACTFCAIPGFRKRHGFVTVLGGYMPLLVGSLQLVGSLELVWLHLDGQKAPWKDCFRH